MTNRTPEPSRRQVPRWKLTMVIVAAALVVTLAIQNAATVSIRLLLWQFEISRAALILVVLLVGFLVGRVSRRRRRP